MPASLIYYRTSNLNYLFTQDCSLLEVTALDTCFVNNQRFPPFNRNRDSFTSEINQVLRNSFFFFSDLGTQNCLTTSPSPLFCLSWYGYKSFWPSGDWGRSSLWQESTAFPECWHLGINQLFFPPTLIFGSWGNKQPDLNPVTLSIGWKIWSGIFPVNCLMEHLSPPVTDFSRAVVTTTLAFDLRLQS